MTQACALFHAMVEQQTQFPVRSVCRMAAMVLGY